ncbi:MAG: hypothetical protein UU08_C0008G0032 [Candidatus Uhrbacteria bacterium GW2011_GWE2_40_58]|nr:MAG: hypothetical protein UT94_C0008G0033 [Candidatus Uhrbacteria bacterium GW2011_GWF2_40_263]KKR67826.1 MAG: hypothetical protein UU08_C0008G0032 [Candidatus Uhrbacteria bacterium GW2011_GWE2_40_58]OGL94531.1 MAG: hypothetical protein A2239_00595 [Candidatus Uhrbacteria bacterium RIFOXYA2_FULL_40_9]OGL96782.1 MAG: hypothetical protein A2332_04570 [Candidatus Uhrbacteria bacterium RIFOXYB2_FULL_41_18]HBK34499.1 hypothetical protein [Candidatus Uhrbacteria bacterium]
MFKRFLKKHIPESLALAATFAAAVTLTFAWILNLLVTRVDVFYEWFVFSERFGVVSGLYFSASIIYLVSLFLMLCWYRNKDCSHQRENVFWFFLSALFVFFVMTLPGIFSFEIFVQNM